MLEDLIDFIKENMQINEKDVGIGVRYDATIYLGFEKGGGANE
jgi:hypothetical protein